MLELAQTKIEELKRDGFVFFREMFPVELSRRAYTEITHCYDIDVEERLRNGIAVDRYHGSRGVTVKTKPSHLLIDAYGRSPALDDMVETILTHPVSSPVFHAMVGKHFKWRGYNVRRMSGEYDPGPPHPRRTTLPHDWHRDSPGEFGIGILLTDVPLGGNGGTALLAGSHLLPYCPRWNTLFSWEYYTSQELNVCGVGVLTRFALCNRLLARQLMPQAMEATGKQGDFFYFLNDVWHGRFPNLHGKQSTIVLLGGFPTEFPFPDDVRLPPASVIEKLPPTIQRGLIPMPPNEDKSALIYWMLENRQPLRTLSLMNLAKWERQLANSVSSMKHGVWQLLGLKRQPSTTQLMPPSTNEPRPPTISESRADAA